MPIPKIGYALATISNLRSISPADRATGYIRSVTEQRSWYMFIADATDTPDEVTICSPLSGTGRWFRLKGLVVPNEIAGLTEYIQDVIGNSFLASSVLTFTYDDSNNVINVAFTDGSITNAHIASNAAIAQSKIANLTSDLTAIYTSLTNKADIGHTHTSANISDFSEAVDDRVAALLLQGTNITLDYNDVTNTLMISSSGGGGSGGGGFDWDTIDESAWDATY